uniref:WD_REPEATS_REGION domain-containing protein n=1 Tax=Caenorhabditis japonica TaxID=281687 RepID=A0A8R1EA96_CAEJA
MQMGQKLRTALRGPPVFRDGSKFRLNRLLEGHKDGVWHVVADSSRNVCASASADQTARVWSLETGACLATYMGHTGSVNCVAISQHCTVDNSDGCGPAAGLILATASGDESTHIWRVPSNNAPLEHSSEEEEDHHGGGGDPNNLLGMEQSCYKYTNEKACGHRIRVPLTKLTGHRAPVSCCEWLAGGQQMVTASWDRSANVWDVEKGEVVNMLTGHDSELNHCSTHAHHKLLLTSSKDSTFRVWDFRESIQSVAVFQGHQDSVTSAVFHSDYRIVSSSDDATVKIWDLRSMRTPLADIRLSSPANRIAVSKSAGVIAVPMDNRHVRVYDLHGNRLPRMPNRRCHERMVTCCAWMDEQPSNNLLTAGFDRMVAAWKVNTSTS